MVGAREAALRGNWVLLGRRRSAGRQRRSLVSGRPARRHGEQHGGDGGREVEARDARAHRDADARVGAREQLLAEAVALGAEGEHRAWGRAARGSSGSPSGSSAEQRPLERGRAARALQPRDRQREVQAGGAAQRVGVPRVVAAGGEHGGGVGGGGDAHAGAHVAEVAGILEQHHRRWRAGRRARRGASTAGRSASAITPVARRQRRELRRTPPASTSRASVRDALGEVGRERRRQALELGAVARERPRARRRRSAARA